jgi:signal transduction histidine kinase
MTTKQLTKQSISVGVAGTGFIGPAHVEGLRRNGIQVLGLAEQNKELAQQKAAELELKESHKRIETMNEKLHVISSLTRHDIGNKLNIAQANLLFLKDLPKDDPEFSVCLNEIKTALDQSIKIIQFNKQYEKIGAEKLLTIDVGEQFNLAANLRPHGNLEIINSVFDLTVLADNMLQQLFYNLIDNSLKHGITVSSIKLSCENIDGQIKLIYEDNGQGIAEENKDKIFLEGFTTGGSGLGLKLVKRVIEFYGWTIVEQGDYGKGAKFIITIPAR